MRLSASKTPFFSLLGVVITQHQNKSGDHHQKYLFLALDLAYYSMEMEISVIIDPADCVEEMEGLLRFLGGFVGGLEGGEGRIGF